VIQHRAGQHQSPAVPDLVKRSCHGFRPLFLKRLSSHRIIWSERCYYKHLTGLLAWRAARGDRDRP
jgi:hypothetical protein